MCLGMMQPPYGIPINAETHEKFSDEVKKAWVTFHNWWQQNFDGSNPVSRASMPPEVAAAFQKMKETPIPGYDGATGEDSCYVVGVNMHMTD